MKFSILLAFIFTLSFSFSQITFNTGSGELDANLTDINERGKGDFISFKNELRIDFNIPVPKLENMRVKLGLEPGEIYLALEIARNSPSSLDEVLRIYEANKSKGWGYIAKQAGIKPGSAAFHQLKNNSKGRKDKGGKPKHVKEKSPKKGKSKGKGNSKKGK
jgi:hypothetical protein